MRQGFEVRWILLACAVLNCLGILLSAGEYRGMVSDGIYDFLASTGSDPNIQLESLRGYQFRWLLHGHGAVIFFLGFLWGNRAVTRVPCLAFFAWGALWRSPPLWVPGRGGGRSPCGSWLRPYIWDASPICGGNTAKTGRSSPISFQRFNLLPISFCVPGV